MVSRHICVWTVTWYPLTASFRPAPSEHPLAPVHCRAPQRDPHTPENVTSIRGPCHELQKREGHMPAGRRTVQNLISAQIKANQSLFLWNQEAVFFICAPGACTQALPQASGVNLPGSRAWMLQGELRHLLLADSFLNSKSINSFPPLRLRVWLCLTPLQLLLKKKKKVPQAGGL